MNFNVKVSFDILGSDFVAIVEGRVTASSQKAILYGDNASPAEGPDWEIDNIELRHVCRHMPGMPDDKLEVPSWLFDMIADMDEVAEQIRCAEAEDGPDPDALYEARRDAEMVE